MNKREKFSNPIRLKTFTNATAMKWRGVYFRHVHSAVPQPKEALCGFTRVHLGKGETANVTVDVPAERFRYWDTAKEQYVVEAGKYQLLIGSASDDIHIRLKVPVKVGD